MHDLEENPRPVLGLAHRLPNPPPAFVGRGDALAFLEQALDRAPLALITGPGGIGKTALGLAYLHHHRGGDLSRTLALDLRNDAPVEDVRLRVLRALEQARGLKVDKRAGALHHEGALDAVLLDLAESEPYTVFVDDLHHADPASASALLLSILRYGQRSKWLFISRTLPGPSELEPQILRLGGLDHPNLAKLALAHRPDLDDETRALALRRAAGSPLSLRLNLCLRPGDEIEDPLLGGLSGEARDLVRTLSLVDIPLGPRVLEAIHGRPIDEALALCEARGLLHGTPSGWRLHDVVRGTLRQAEPSDQGDSPRRRIAELLAGHPDHALCLEGLRILYTLGEVDRVWEILEARGRGVLEAGMASRLWALLERLGDARFDRWRMRTGIAVGTAQSLAQVRLPAHPTAGDLLLWAQGKIYLQESGAEAALQARQAAITQGDGDLAFEAGLVAVNALIVRFRFQEALDLGAELTPTSAIGGHYRALCMAVARCGRGTLCPEDLLLLQVDWPPEYERATYGLRSHLAMLAQAHGRYDLALHHARRWADGDDEALPRAAALSLAANLHTLAGELTRAHAYIERLARIVGQGESLYSALRRRRLSYDIQAGDLGRARALFEEERRQWAGIERLAPITGITEVELATLAGAAPPSQPRTPPWAGAGLMERVWILTDLVWRSRHPGPLDSALLEAAAAPESGTPERLLALLASAQVCLLTGDPRGGLRLIEGGLALVAQSGMGMMAWNLHLLALDLHLILGDHPRILSGGEALRRLSRARGSARGEGEADFYLSLFAPEPAWHRLAALSQGENRAPVAARRAQALLGEAPDLDGIDRAVLGHIRQHLDLRLEILPEDRGPFSAEDRAQRWGMVDGERSVWLPEGSAVSFRSRGRAWELLNHLFDLGGAGSKEALILGVWGERSYHPSRHDNRLHQTVATLRKLVEDDPAEPTRVLTTEEGYRLSGPVVRLT